MNLFENKYFAIYLLEEAFSKRITKESDPTILLLHCRSNLMRCAITCSVLFHKRSISRSYSSFLFLPSVMAGPSTPAVIALFEFPLSVGCLCRWEIRGSSVLSNSGLCTEDRIQMDNKILMMCLHALNGAFCIYKEVIIVHLLDQVKESPCGSTCVIFE